MLLGATVDGDDLGSLTLVQGHHKKSGNLSCVSFGEECIAYSLAKFTRRLLENIPQRNQ